MEETIFLGADHQGFAEKERAKLRLKEAGHNVVDLGAKVLNEGDDYPQYAQAVAGRVAAGEGLGLLFCASGQGMAMAANRMSGARAALAWNPEVALESRRDNDANILVIPVRFVSSEEADAIIAAFLSAKFSGAERHARRIAQIDKH